MPLVAQGKPCTLTPFSSFSFIFIFNSVAGFRFHFRFCVDGFRFHLCLYDFISFNFNFNFNLIFIMCVFKKWKCDMVWREKSEYDYWPIAGVESPRNLVFWFAFLYVHLQWQHIVVHKLFDKMLKKDEVPFIFVLNLGWVSPILSRFWMRTTSTSDSGDNVCCSAEEVAIRIIGANEKESRSSRHRWGATVGIQAVRRHTIGIVIINSSIPSREVLIRL